MRIESTKTLSKRKIKKREKNFSIMFPLDLEKKVKNVFRVIKKKTPWFHYPPDKPYRANSIFTNGWNYLVKESSVILTIGNVYYDEIDEDIFEKLTIEEKQIYHCIYSLHYNGYIREKHITKILNYENLPSWTIPFIFVQTQRYITEIIPLIYERFKNDKCFFKEFVANNFEHIKRGNDRMISYWNLHCRADTKNIKDYVGYKLYKEIFLAYKNKKRRKGIKSPTNRPLETVEIKRH
ncbi:MAG: hypothetical protein FWC02_02010 [Firmicutes bacterium]|nr:hypothetical protein [Bacillota bacterium]